jgi:hypothetical protein
VINKLIIDTLKPTNIPVAFQFYSGKETTYITFSEYLQMGESYSDDVEELTGHYIQVDVWSKTDYSTITAQVKSLMLSAGFKRTDEIDLFEPDTKVFHKGMRFFYAEEII